ncbi:MAG: TetR/AcrR family transcriptional regulator [Aggregatilineales bacterium]
MAHNQKTDRRILRTRRMLRETLMNLIMEHGYDVLTITDIANMADIRRGTFYDHYDSVDALLLACLRDEFEGVIEHSSELFDVLQILRYLEQHAARFRRLCEGRAELLLYAFFRDTLPGSQIQPVAHPQDDAAARSQAFINEYRAASEAAMIVWWLQHDMLYTPEKLAEMLADIQEKGLSEKFRD